METFWQTIDKALGGADPKKPSLSPQALKLALNALHDDDVKSFEHEYQRKLIELNRWDLWGAGFVISGGMSDDSFHYFRSWIIGKVEACYQIALTNPGALAPFVDNLEIENESLEYVSSEVLESRGIHLDDDSSEVSPDGEPSGDPFEEDEVFDVYPDLAALS